MITQIGMVGLRRMGANMARRILKQQHVCVVYDQGAASVKTMEAEGAKAASSPEDLVKKLTTPRVVWLMAPAGEGPESTVTALGKLPPQRRTVIDGGRVQQPNSGHTEAAT
jgi:6-phosphogluconate dehydrogenase